MNFFDQQLARKRQSALLLVCFAIALVATGALIHFGVALVSLLLGQSVALFEPSVPALVLIGLVWTIILFGAYFRSLDVKAGGAILARRFGAVHASDRSRYEKEQQLLNVVAEISIASSTPQPDVYILRAESSINAFVLGAEERQGHAGRYAIVVTQGALDNFDRDELQAVVAHEFGHIANGDLPVNMRLLIALGGLMAIDEVGQLLVGEEPDSLIHPGVLVGYFVIGLGSIGVFFGQLIRSAFCRQREYLADACAVQFTRNPYAMASALAVVKNHAQEPALHGIHVKELAHMCFQSGKGKAWFNRLLVSHPHIQNRIDAIDPHFDVKQKKVAEKRNLDYESGTKGASHLTPEKTIITVSDLPVGSELSDSAVVMLADTRNSVATLFALFASENASKKRDYLSAISFAFDKQFSSRVKDIVGLIPDELSDNKLALIELATIKVCQSVERSSRQSILKKLESLLSVSGEYDLMAYASLQLIRGKLDLEFPLIDTLADDHFAQGRHTKAFDEMGSEFALLLSLMIESSGASSAVQTYEFERVLKCYTMTQYPRRTCHETGIVAEVAAAFQTLYVQPKAIREAFVQHCVEIVQKDGHVARAERTLLDLFAASLGCDEHVA